VVVLALIQFTGFDQRHDFAVMRDRQADVDQLAVG
jgi:hypothetical protein